MSRTSVTLCLFLDEAREGGGGGDEASYGAEKLSHRYKFTPLPVQGRGRKNMKHYYFKM